MLFCKHLFQGSLEDKSLFFFGGAFPAALTALLPKAQGISEPSGVQSKEITIFPIKQVNEKIIFFSTILFHSCTEEKSIEAHHCILMC